MKERKRVSSGAKWEPIVGYSRAVRVDNRIHVAGTAAVGPDGAVMYKGDAYSQAKRCLEIIEQALRELGAGPEHVVRTRMFVLEPEMWEQVGRAHGEMFAEVRPATTMVFTRFIDPDMLVEIEAEAEL